jgi:hypothetical protein
MALIDRAQLLVDLVQRLLQQHRAGITPAFGEIEDLADLADGLQEALSRRRPGARARGRRR